MTYRMTCMAPLCNGESMAVTHDFKAADDRAARTWVARWRKKNRPIKEYPDKWWVPRLESIRQVRL